MTDSDDIRTARVWGPRPANTIQGKRSSRIVIIFLSVHRVCWEEGSRAAGRFWKMVHLLKRGLKINIFKVLFGRSQKKGTLCTLLIMLTILDDPITLLSYARLTDRPVAMIVKIKSEKECDVSTRFCDPRSYICGP